MPNPVKIAKGIESLLKKKPWRKHLRDKRKPMGESLAEPQVHLGWLATMTPARMKISDEAIQALQKLDHLPKNHPKRLKVLNDTIAKLEELKKLPGENFSVLAAPALEEALAKMAETTMMPEPSFGTKAGNLLIDVLSPVPRYK